MNKYVDTLEKAINEQIEREKILREQLQNESVSQKATELGKAIGRTRKRILKFKIIS